MEQIKKQFTIHSALFPYFEEKINKYNKRAKKTSCTPIELHIVNEEIKTRNADRQTAINAYNMHLEKGVMSIELKELFYNIEVIGEVPQINGYKFSATIEHTENGNILNSIHKTDLPEEYRTTKPYCDHCNVKRYRKNTFVIFNEEENKFLQIGKSCLKDFLPSTNVNDIANNFVNYNHMIEEFFRYQESYSDELEDFSGIRLEPTFSTEEYLSIVCELISRFGYKKEGNETKYHAWQELIKPFKYKPDITNEDPITEENKEKALKAIEWVNEVIGNKTNKNDYEHNLTVIIKSGIVKYKHIGYVASVIPAYEKYLGIKAEKEIQEKNKEVQKLNSEYQGTIGKRQVFENLTVTKITYFDTMYGTTKIHTFTDELNNCYVWFCSGASLDSGETYKSLKATVKDHKEYNGIKQTILSRVTV